MAGRDFGVRWRDAGIADRAGLIAIDLPGGSGSQEKTRTSLRSFQAAPASVVDVQFSTQVTFFTRAFFGKMTVEPAVVDANVGVRATVGGSPIRVGKVQNQCTLFDRSSEQPARASRPTPQSSK